MDDDWGYPYDLGNLPLGVNIDIYIYINMGGIYDLRGDLLYQLYLTNSI